MIGIEGRLQVRNYENRSPALSSEALSHPQLVGNKAGVRQYLSEVLVNRFTFLESKKSNNALESVDTFKEQHDPTTEINNNPFTTATTLAGSLNRAMNPISVSDDDLPF